MEGVKCVWVGDDVAEKTKMLFSYTTESFPTECIPTVFDNYQANVMVEGRPISLGLWDTSGQSDYDRLWPGSYPNTDVFVVCYSITSPSSLESIKTKWLPEIRSHCPNAPFVLLGTTKSDLRKLDVRALQKLKAKGDCLVDSARVDQIAQELGAARVLECSAKDQASLKNVVDQSIKVALAARTPVQKRKKRLCTDVAQKRTTGLCSDVAQKLKKGCVVM